MSKIDLKHTFSKKVDFRGGRPHYAYPSIVTGAALRQAEGLASGQAQAHPSCRQVVREVQFGLKIATNFN